MKEIAIISLLICSLLSCTEKNVSGQVTVGKTVEQIRAEEKEFIEKLCRDAYNTSLELIADNYLKSPSTAKFASSISGIKIMPIARHKFYAESYVDSENAFGATVRTPFEVWIHYEPNKSVSIDKINFL